MAFNKQYADLSNEIERRFREELSEQKGNLSGLEDFYQLSLIIKRNFQVTKQVINLFMKMRDISSYNIVEETNTDSNEKVVEKLIEDLA